MDKGWGIIQLPCPKLCYQSLQWSSIYPGDDTAQAYRAYGKELLEPLVKNIEEYKSMGSKSAALSAF